MKKFDLEKFIKNYNDGLKEANLDEEKAYLMMNEILRNADNNSTKINRPKHNIWKAFTSNRKYFSFLPAFKPILFVPLILLVGLSIILFHNQNVNIQPKTIAKPATKDGNITLKSVQSNSFNQDQDVEIIKQIDLLALARGTEKAKSINQFAVEVIKSELNKNKITFVANKTNDTLSFVMSDDLKYYQYVFFINREESQIVLSRKEIKQNISQNVQHKDLDVLLSEIEQKLKLYE